MSLDAIMPSTQSFFGWTTHSRTSISLQKCHMVQQIDYKVRHDLHNLFLMEITLDNAHRAALARGHSIDRQYLVYKPLF